MWASEISAKQSKLASIRFQCFGKLSFVEGLLLANRIYVACLADL